jgi:hypothetical protein
MIPIEKITQKKGPSTPGDGGQPPDALGSQLFPAFGARQLLDTFACRDDGGSLICLPKWEFHLFNANSRP